MDGNFAEQATGVKPPRSFILDASVLELREEHKIISEDIKRNRVAFEFPDGLGEIDISEECRALALIDDFEAMYDYTMQKLVGKSVVIWMRQDDGSKTLLCQFHVSDRYQNLHGVEEIDRWPVLMNWLTEFIGAHLAKQYPTPTNVQSPRQASESRTAATTRKADSTEES
jgi:hypothetical protein